MSLKRIIIFVLLGIMIYAGGFFLFYGADAMNRSKLPTTQLSSLSPESIQANTVVSGTIYQQVEMIGHRPVRRTFLGIEYGKPAEQYFYVIPFEYKKEFKDIRYMVIAVTDPESVRLMDSLYVIFPKKPDANAPKFEFKGVTEEMSYGTRTAVIDFLSKKKPALAGVDGLTRNPTIAYYENRVIPYTVYVTTHEDNGLSALVTGSVLCVSGAGAAILLILKIKREKY